jgi:hypothetical protein
VIAFREIDDADPALAFSPLVRGMEEECDKATILRAQ